MGKILGLLTVKNEVDIIQRMLDANGRFMDFVVVDNGSTDGTYEIVKGHKSVLESIVDTTPYNENTLTKVLFAMADKYQAEWYFEIDADEIIDDSFADFILPALPVNCVTSKIYYCLPDERVYKTYNYWQRLYRNPGLQKAVADADTEIQKLHMGKMPIPRAERVFVHSQIPIRHYQVRSYEQGMKKYQQYLTLDSALSFQPKGYEHLKKLAESIKTGDYSKFSIKGGR